MLVKFQCANKVAGGLIDSVLVTLRYSLNVCISTKLRDDTDATGMWTTLKVKRIMKVYFSRQKMFYLNMR